MTPRDHIHTLSGPQFTLNKFWLCNSLWAVIEP